MRTIAIINQKGGCGKTTSAINIAGILARKGFRTLLVDMDPQSHCAAGLAIPEQRIDLDIGDAMLLTPDQDLDTTRLLWRASRNLDLAPSRMRLAGLEASRGGLADKPDKERRLAGVLSRLARGYDACVIDCSPSIGLLTFNALAAANEVLIPVETSYFSLQGATKQVNTIRTISKRLGAPVPYWLIATIHDEGSALARDLLDEMRRRFGKRVAPAVIRRDGTLKEAASFGQPVIEYAATSQGAQDYAAFTEWLIGAASLSCAGRPPTPQPVIVEPTEVFESPTEAADEISGGSPDPEPPTRTDDGPVSPSRIRTPVVVSGAPAAPSVSVGPVAAPLTESVSVALAEPPAPQAETVAQAAVVASRAEDLAQRARLLLLKRADEQLRRVASIQRERPGAMPAAEPKMTVPAGALSLETEGPASMAQRARQESIRRLFGARQTRSGVLFVQPIHAGFKLCIAGDFNGWSATANPMQRNESLGVFELCLPLPPGKQRYRLVIDGRWCPDPFNESTEANPFGEPNSVVLVESGRA